MSRLPNNAKILEYKIIDQLGVGGFAHTYHAVDTNLNKKVAIKEFFPPSLCHRADEYRVEALPGAEDLFKTYLGQFIEEARILAKFDQPNIVKVLRYFEALGTAFIIMEFVEGKPMSAYFAFDHVLGEERINRWLTGILRGLGTVHESHIIHGDIKPTNVLINASDEAVLIDFGASVVYESATESTESANTRALSPNYAAPEQFLVGAKLDHRLDLYGVGAVFFEAITGEKLKGIKADGNDFETELHRYRRHYHQKLLRSVCRALEDRPEARFPDAEGWLDSINLSSAERLGRFIRRRQKTFAAIAVLLIAALYGFHYKVENEVDAKNYWYKLFASTDAVVERVRSGEKFEQAVRDRIALVDDYEAQYRKHAERINPQHLVTGRNNLQSQQRVRDEAQRAKTKLAQMAAQIRTLKDRYYFDDYGPVLAETQAIIDGFSNQQPGWNKPLFGAFVEHQIVSKALERKISLDRVTLSQLLGKLAGDDSGIPLDEMVTRGEPVVKEFLEGERGKNEVAAFAVAKRHAVDELRDIAVPYRKSKHFREFEAIIAEAATADRLKAIAELNKRARQLAVRIKGGRKVAAKKAAAARVDARVRSLVDGIDAQMIRIDGGSFQMGSSEHRASIPPRTVKVHPFHVMKTEVMNAHWRECVRQGKCRKVANGNSPDFPVTQVSWNDAKNFVGWINSKSKRFRYRLMSEAEWEYIVRQYGFRRKELSDGLSSVSVNQANKRGVNSIVGNALEWLDDCWHGGYYGAPQDSRSWNRGIKCNLRMVRGSNWGGAYQINQNNVSYYRPQGVAKKESKPTLGFRLAGESR